jgi:sterol desaturase/sphingolipid hydroxylase (fatty acid hydroxylase superfamily)
VTPLHAVHHRDPRAVFAIGAWPPAAALAVVLLVFSGLAPWAMFYYGLLCGFIVYEIIHYRLHFARALTPYEERLRNRHLVHHLRRPRMCLGVVSGFWDRVLGTEPEGQEMAALCDSVSHVEPLTGFSNFHQLVLYFASAFGRGFSA